MEKVKLKDTLTGQTVLVHVRHKQKGAEITGTKIVYFGKILGKGREYAFRVPSRFKRF